MKALLSIAFLACAALARGGDVQVTWHLMETSQAGMAAVFAENLPDAQLLRRMREMVKTGEAKERDTILVRAKEGEHVILESFREIIHPTARNAPSVQTPNEVMTRVQRISKGWRKVSRFFPAFPDWEGSFETRFVGMMLGFTSVGRDRADHWGLSLGEWSGNVPVAKVRTPDGGIAEARYPLFDNERVGSYLPLADGQWRMLAVINGPPGAGKKTFVFVKVDLLR